MIGMTMSFTKLLISSPNAMPMITATARSRTLPFVMNLLKSASMGHLLRRGPGTVGPRVDDGKGSLRSAFGRAQSVRFGRDVVAVATIRVRPVVRERTGAVVDAGRELALDGVTHRAVAVGVGFDRRGRAGHLGTRRHRKRLRLVARAHRALGPRRDETPRRVRQTGERADDDTAAEERAHRRSLASARPEFVDLRPGLWDDPASYVIRPAQPEPPPYVTASTKRYSPHPLVPPGREG